MRFDVELLLMFSVFFRRTCMYWDIDFGLTHEVVVSFSQCIYLCNCSLIDRFTTRRQIYVLGPGLQPGIHDSLFLLSYYVLIVYGIIRIDLLL